MRAVNKVGIVARSMAFRVILVSVVGTLIGSMLPESGNVLVFNFKLSNVFNPFGFPRGHVFNPCFLALGIAGIVLALFVGHRKRS